MAEKDVLRKLQPCGAGHDTEQGWRWEIGYEGNFHWEELVSVLDNAVCDFLPQRQRELAESIVSIWNKTQTVSDTLNENRKRPSSAQEPSTKGYQPRRSARLHTDSWTKQSSRPAKRDTDLNQLPLPNCELSPSPSPPVSDSNLRQRKIEGVPKQSTQYRPTCAKEKEQPSELAASEIELLKMIIENHAAEIEKLREEHAAEMRETIKTYETKIAGLRNQVEEQRKLSELQAKALGEIQKLNQEVTGLQGMVKTAGLANEGLQNQHDELRKRLEDAQNKVAEAEETNRDLQRRHAEQAAKATELRGQLEDARRKATSADGVLTASGLPAMLDELTDAIAEVHSLAQDHKNKAQRILNKVPKRKTYGDANIADLLREVRDLSMKTDAPSPEPVYNSSVRTDTPYSEPAYLATDSTSTVFNPTSLPLQRLDPFVPHQQSSAAELPNIWHDAQKHIGTSTFPQYNQRGPAKGPSTVQPFDSVMPNLYPTSTSQVAECSSLETTRYIQDEDGRGMFTCANIYALENSLGPCLYTSMVQSYRRSQENGATMTDAVRLYYPSVPGEHFLLRLWMDQYQGKLFLEVSETMKVWLGVFLARGMHITVVRDAYNDYRVDIAVCWADGMSLCSSGGPFG